MVTERSTRSAVLAMRGLLAIPPRNIWFQARNKIEVPLKQLTKKTSRSSGPGGQSVNKAETHVRLSFQLNTAEWIPQVVREKMADIHKNRISKTGELAVSCMTTSSQIENTKLAVVMIEDLIKEAEKAVERDVAESEKKPFIEWVIEEKLKAGRGKEIEKRLEGRKFVKELSRERTRSKKIDF